MKKNTLLYIGLFLIGLSSYSQELNTVINSFKNETQAIITLNKNLKTPGFIKLPFDKAISVQGKSIKEKVFNFLLQNKGIYAIQSIEETFSPEGVLKIDNYGLKHYEVKQFYKGITVYDSGLKFHFDRDEKISSINGTIIPDINLEVIPNIAQSKASTIAFSIINKLGINHSNTPLKIISNELMIFPKGLVQGLIVSKHLTYRIEVRNDTDVREFLFIDAHSGKLIEQFTGIAHSLDRVLHEVNTSNTAWEEGFSFPGFLNIWQQNEVAAAGHTYHFFNNAFGYDSFDGAGGQMITINNNPNINCPNATWNGVSTNYCTGTASDDVVAHEWGHAYTGSTSNLIYAYESGALNESYSDIWGETIDLLNNYEDAGEDLSLRTSCSNSDRWKMGEDATAFGGAIRDMWNPNCNGDPGSTTDSNYNCDYALNDNGGVHTNSGIPNHLYALLVDGGTYNGETISALGFTKAAHIFWRAQSEYLSASSDFTVFADAIEASCSDLIGTNLEGLSTTATAAGLSGEIISNADLTNVNNALIAVTLRTDNSCVFTTVLDSDTTAICAAAASNPIFNEDWENGIGSWTVTQLPVNSSTWEAREWNIVTDLPQSRSGSSMYAPNPVNGNCTTDLENGVIRLETPTITIPNYTNGIFELAFNHSMSSEEDFDGGNLKFSIDGGNWAIIPATAFTQNAYNLTLNNTNNDSPLMGEAAFSGTDVGSFDSVWGQSVIDLSSIGVVANSSLRLRWEFGSDGCNGVDGWYVDEVVIYNCSEVLAIADINNLDDIISIYPNPSEGIFNLKLKNLSNFTFDLYDITGKNIMNKIPINKNDFTIDLNQLQKGLYFIKLQSEIGTITKKLILQ